MTDSYKTPNEIVLEVLARLLREDFFLIEPRPNSDRFRLVIDGSLYDLSAREASAFAQFEAAACAS